MITLYQPVRVDHVGKSRLQAEFEMDGNKSLLWYETSEKYGSYMTTERLDGFVVGLLWLALKKGQDILVMGPMSERLYYSLNFYLIPLIVQMYKYKQIHVRCDQLVSTSLPNEGGVGTGLSCGIDSLSTACEHLADNVPPHYKITHFTFFNVGANVMVTGKQWTEKMFNARAAIAASCAAELGKELIVVDSNIDDVLKMGFVRTHTLRNMSVVLLFQKLFNVYYYSSGFQTVNLKFGEDAASYDPISLPLLSTENLMLYSSGSSYTRVQKTKMVADFEPSYKYLNVCLDQMKNCGRCLKCKRTLLTLEVLGAIDKYKGIFNMGAYSKVRDSYLEEVVKCKDSNSLYKEICDEMERTKFLEK